MRIVPDCPALLFVFAFVAGLSPDAPANSGAIYSASTPDDGASCLVVDPTSTPLNVRAAPQGQIISTISNGQLVHILDQAQDSRGKQWAYIADAKSRPFG